jgi:hypothetical protein
MLGKKSKLAKEEIKRLEEISDAFDYRFSIPLKEHFHKSGRLEKMEDAVTKEEKQEQRAAIKGILSFNMEKRTKASLKVVECFTKAALRVGTDEEISKFISKDKIVKEDVELLKKHEFHSLAAVAQASLG